MLFDCCLTGRVQDVADSLPAGTISAGEDMFTLPSTSGADFDGSGNGGLPAYQSASQQGSSAAAAGPSSGAAAARSPGGWLGVRRPARVPRGSGSSDGGSGNLAPRISAGARLSSGGASEADAEVRDVVFIQLRS